MISAQCGIRSLYARPYSPSPAIELKGLWTCDEGKSLFRYSKQLINRDQCDTGDGSEQLPFDLRLGGWNYWVESESDPPTYPIILLEALPYSTYAVVVEATIEATIYANGSYLQLQLHEAIMTDVTTGEAGE